MGGRFGGMGGGMYPRPGLDGQEVPLSAQVEQSTQQAFFVLDQIVQAFTGFSQMLESTFHATHSSFMAMVGVAEQFGNLRNGMASAFNIVALLRTVRNLGRRVMGQGVERGDLTGKAFEVF
jgi:peroxin-13